MNKEITRRDYLAAHAPTEKWVWWKPDVPDRPTKPSGNPSEYVNGLTEEEIENGEQWVQDPCYDLPERFKPFVDVWEAFWPANRDWKENYEVNCDMQWPYAYADLVVGVDMIMRGKI